MKTSEKIIDYIKSHGQTTTVELVDYLNLTDRAIRKQLKALSDAGHIVKAGRPPRVYYSLTSTNPRISPSPTDAGVSPETSERIEKDFFYISPRGEILAGWNGFVYWCQERTLSVAKMSAQYQRVANEYDKYKKYGLIDGMPKMKATFEVVYLDKLFYVDFYSLEIFGKTKLGQQLLYAKQSQDRRLMNELTDSIKPSILKVISEYRINAVGFIPPTVKRELQLMKQIQNRLNLSTRVLSLSKLKTPVAVPQKTLNKLSDRIVNARETIMVDDNSRYQNILLIDDAVGSGSTLNETAKKIKQKNLCDGQIIGLAVTGSFKGFDVISEV